MSLIYTHKYFFVEFKKNEFHFTSRLPSWGRHKHPIILQTLEMKKFITELEKNVARVKNLHLLPSGQESSLTTQRYTILSFRISNLVRVDARTYDGKKVRVYLKYLLQRICCDDLNTRELEKFYYKCTSVINTF